MKTQREVLKTGIIVCNGRFSQPNHSLLHLMLCIFAFASVCLSVFGGGGTKICTFLDSSAHVGGEKCFYLFFFFLCCSEMSKHFWMMMIDSSFHVHVNKFLETYLGMNVFDVCGILHKFQLWRFSFLFFLSFWWFKS